LVLPLDAQFQVGSRQETVTVSTEVSAPVETESSQVSNLVDSQRIKALPLITRNPYELVLLSPGASQSNGIGGFTVNGSRDRNNNFLLDGVDNNDTSVPGIAGGALNANPENTEEFRIITNNFDAEYGRNTGGVIDVVTKSGTNRIHFDAYFFGRYKNIGGARDWFNPAPSGPQNPYVRNQFGYSVGGPIWKDKTFFFFNQEFQRFPTAQTATVYLARSGLGHRTTRERRHRSASWFSPKRQLCRPVRAVHFSSGRSDSAEDSSPLPGTDRSELRRLQRSCLLP
jgi:hypothetical protein